MKRSPLWLEFMGSAQGFQLLGDHQLKTGGGVFQVPGIPGHRVIIGLILGFIGKIIVGLIQVSQ